MGKPQLQPGHAVFLGGPDFWDWEKNDSSFVYQLLHTSLPGTLDTSFISTDYINNPRTMNAIYSVGPRLGPALRWGQEKLAGGSLKNKQFQDFPQTAALSQFYKAPDTVWTPRVLKDGSDSVDFSARSIACLSISDCLAKSGCCTSMFSSAARRSHRSGSKTPKRIPVTGMRRWPRRRMWRCSF